MRESISCCATGAELESKTKQVFHVDESINEMSLSSMHSLHWRLFKLISRLGMFQLKIHNLFRYENNSYSTRESNQVVYLLREILHVITPIRLNCLYNSPPPPTSEER